MSYRIPVSKELSRLLYEAYQRGPGPIRIVSESSRWYVEADPDAVVREGALVADVLVPPRDVRFKRREIADAVVADLRSRAELSGGVTQMVRRKIGSKRFA